MNYFKKLIISLLLILVIQFKKTEYNTKINEIENKINDHDHAKYITTQEFNKLTADIFTARLPPTNLASKDDVENELHQLSEKVKAISTKDQFFTRQNVFYKQWQ